MTVASAAGFSPGQIVLLDEASGASWQADPQGRGQIWASPDWRVVWQKHDPVVPYVDDFAADAFPTTPGTAGSWFSRLDRPTAEIKQIASISETTITFTTPIHISYRSSHAAQLSRYALSHVMNAGVEDLTLIGGDNGNLRFHWTALSWARNVENTVDTARVSPSTGPSASSSVSSMFTTAPGPNLAGEDTQSVSRPEHLRS